MVLWVPAMAMADMIQIAAAADRAIASMR